MANSSRYSGVNFNNLRKALYLMYFGVDLVKDNKGNVIKALSQDFDSPKYKYIIPMQGNFENPLELKGNDTFILYWIERDESLTQDDYTEEQGIPVNRQKCVATILVRFIGKDAEDWAKAMRHLTKRSNVGQIWSGVCNAERLEYTAPIVPRKIYYSGLNSQIGFDVRFRLYYDEAISVGWVPLAGVNFEFEGEIKVQSDSNALSTDQ